MNYFLGNSAFARLFKYQISQLVVKFGDESSSSIEFHRSTVMFQNILYTFTSLIKLNFMSNSPLRPNIVSLDHFRLPALLELHVYILNFNACLLLLDGRLSQLQIFIVEISNICHTRRRPLTITNTVCIALY